MLADTSNTSEILRGNIPKILVEWELQACKNIFSSAGVTSLVLKNAIHEFLETMADALLMAERTDVELARNSATVINFAKIHGGGRAVAPLHYTLPEVILEFQILQKVIFEALENNSPLSLRDHKIIVDIINQALISAATRFSEVEKQAHEQFVLTLVHDLRSPVNVVKMSTHVLRRDTLSEQAIGVIARIDKNIDRLESMLKELLDVGRIRSGIGLSFELVDVRLDVLAKDVIQDMKETHGDRFELEASEPIAGKWNPAGLRRVFENLIVNALKYGSPKTAVKIILTQNDTHATFSVHNEGNPIPEEQHPILFEKFLRGGTSGSQTGWGLGLALVSGMVTAHQGTVRIESSKEKGTNFIVELPKNPS